VTGILDGKVAIVTGAGGGIGAAYSRALAAAGASVVLADLNEAGAKEAADALTADGLAAAPAKVDISDLGSAQATVDLAVQTFGGLDILVNNAALMAELPRVPITEFPVEWWEKLLAVNVSGALYCSRAAVPAMIKRGGGKIVNQSSAGAFDRSGAYSVTKLAVVGLTTVLARDLGKHHINVNAIAPGMVLTDAGKQASSSGALAAKLKQITPLRHEGTPEDLTGALLYLVSAASDWMTGQTLSIDGGWILRP